MCLSFWFVKHGFQDLKTPYIQCTIANVFMRLMFHHNVVCTLRHPRGRGTLALPKHKEEHFRIITKVAHKHPTLRYVARTRDTSSGCRRQPRGRLFLVAWGQSFASGPEELGPLHTLLALG